MQPGGRSSGQRRTTRVPEPGAEVISAWPPALDMRSRIETRTPSRSVGTVASSNPAPSSPTSTWMAPRGIPFTSTQRATSCPACCRLFTMPWTAAE